MNIKETLIIEICCCPYCHAELIWRETNCSCVNCMRLFPRLNNNICFSNQHDELKKESKFHLSLIGNSTFFPRLINLIRKIVTSEYHPNDYLSDILQQLDEDKIVIECGSGNRRLTENIINLDIHPFYNVDLVNDIKMLPFYEETIDVIIFDTVLEHVEEPQKCIDEAFRVLKKGGKIVCITPFIFPYHPYPKHYWNFSEDGLKYLFRHFSNCFIKTDMGPTSALINLVTEYCALIPQSSNPYIYSLIKGLILLPLFPLKYLDRIWNSHDHSKNIAMCLFALVEK